MDTEQHGRAEIEWIGDAFIAMRSTIADEPDFHQRFLADVSADLIRGRWEASEDQGRTWRKDFDLTFRRAQG